MTGILKGLVLGFLALLIAVIAFGTGFGVNYFHAQRAPVAAAASDNTPPAKFGLMWESWNLIKDKFYGDIPAPYAMVHGMIRGALASLGDSHSVLVEPAPAQQEATNLQGTYGGIGAKVESRKGAIVLLPFPDSPADKAGILPGDQVLKVNDKELDPSDTPDSVDAKLQGKVGDQVKIEIDRIGESKPRDFTLTLEEINIPTVQYRMLENTQYAYIQVTLESADTPKEFENALNDLKKNNPKGIVVDLRNNPGGLFPDPSLAIVGEFLPGAPVVIEKYRDGTQKTYNAGNNAQATNIPFVVLVNNGTASAAEIIAGAFLDSGKTTLIGEKTFGKGSVQGLYPLSDKSVLHLTTALWSTPSGNEIDGVGIKPSIQVPLTPDDTAKGLDPQLDRAVEFLNTGK